MRNRVKSILVVLVIFVVMFTCNTGEVVPQRLIRTNTFEECVVVKDEMVMEGKISPERGEELRFEYCTKKPLATEVE